MNGEDVPGKMNHLNCLASMSLIGNPHSILTMDDRYSPAYTVSRWSTPELIIHGSKDYRLPESDGIGVWHALQQYVSFRLDSSVLAPTSPHPRNRLGVPSRLVIFPDENHWVLNAGNSLKWHHEVFKWFDEFVGENASIRVRN